MEKQLKFCPIGGPSQSMCNPIQHSIFLNCKYYLGPMISPAGLLED